MRRKIVLYSIFFLVIFITCLILISCSESDCSITRRPASRFVFKDSNTGLDVALFDSLNVYAVIGREEEDSLLLNRVRAIQYISLPLSYTADTTVFILEYLELSTGYPIPLKDTIWVAHTNIPTFISMDCGRDMFFHIEGFDYSTNVLDSVRLTNPDIRDHEKENFQIFYLVSED